jgi:hypothetical protein
MQNIHNIRVPGAMLGVLFRATGLAVFVIITTVTVGSGQVPPQGELRRILDKVHDRYSNVRSWEFERRVLIEEIHDAAEPTVIRDVTIRTANEAAKEGPPGVRPESLCNALCRLEVSGRGGSLELINNHKGTWLQLSTGEFTQGQSVRDVLSSVATSAWITVHSTPVNSLNEDEWQDSRLLSDEIIEVRGKKRDCYVVEATIKESALPFDLDKFRASSFDGFSRVLGMLATTSKIALPTLMANQPGDPSAYVGPTKDTDPVRARFWIDKETYLIVRRTILEESLKGVWKDDGVHLTGSKPVQLRLSDTFVAADVGMPLPETLFEFRPAGNVREVSDTAATGLPNVRLGGTLPAVCQNASNSGQGRNVGTVNHLIETDDLQASYKESAHDLIVSVEVPSGWVPSINVDVDQDGRKAKPDVSYASGDGRPCTQYIQSDYVTSICGGFKSQATLAVVPLPGRTLFSWTIPKTEISLDMQSTRLQIGAWTRQTILYYPPSFTDACLVKFEAR